MNRNIKLWLDAYFYGAMFGAMFVWLYTIGVAAQNDWIVVLNFNMYGEGVIEYLFMLGWLLIAIYKGCEAMQARKRRVNQWTI